MLFRRCSEIGLLVTLLVTAVSCDIFWNHNGSGKSSINRTVPAPDTVSTADLPVKAENLYYLLIVGDNIERVKDGPEKVLQELLDQNFDLRIAWYPIYPTPCMAPTAAEALVVQLKKNDRRMISQGFRIDPDPFIVNCGIESFKYYQFGE